MRGRCTRSPHTWGSPHGFLSAMKPEKGVVWILGFISAGIDVFCKQGLLTRAVVEDCSDRWLMFRNASSLFDLLVGAGI